MSRTEQWALAVLVRPFLFYVFFVVVAMICYVPKKLLRRHPHSRFARLMLYRVGGRRPNRSEQTLSQ